MKITVEAERKIIPRGKLFKICFLIILRHNHSENRETGTCKCYVASDPVLKSLTHGGNLAQFLVNFGGNLAKSRENLAESQIWPISAMVDVGNR